MKVNKIVYILLLCGAIYTICAVIYVYGFKKNKPKEKKSKDGNPGLISKEDNEQLIKIVNVGSGVEYNEIVDYVLRFEKLKESGKVPKEIEKLENINFSEYINMLNLKNENHEKF